MRSVLRRLFEYVRKLVEIHGRFWCWDVFTIQKWIVEGTLWYVKEGSEALYLRSQTRSNDVYSFYPLVF